MMNRAQSAFTASTSDHIDDPERMLTRGELCKGAGISKTTLRRWETQGKVRAMVDEHGVHLFRLDEVKHLLGQNAAVHLPKARALVPSPTAASGDLAAELFDRSIAGYIGSTS